MVAHRLFRGADHGCEHCGGHLWRRSMTLHDGTFATPVCSLSNLSHKTEGFETQLNLSALSESPSDTAS